MAETNERPSTHYSAIVRARLEQRGVDTTNPGAWADTAALVGPDTARDCPEQAKIAAAEELLRRAPTSAFLTRRFGLNTERRPFRTGRGSAEAVACSLNGLGDRWQVLHGVPVGLDHSRPAALVRARATRHPSTAGDETEDRQRTSPARPPSPGTTTSVALTCSRPHPSRSR